MKKGLLLAAGLFFFGCESRTTTKETESDRTTTTETTTDESVEIGAGTEISPQLEGIDDSASRLKVDTAGTTQDANPKK